MMNQGYLFAAIEEDTVIGGAILFGDENNNSFMYFGRRNGIWVPSHLHFNLTYLAEAEEREELTIHEEENSAVQWWSFEDASKVSTEPSMFNPVIRMENPDNEFLELAKRLVVLRKQAISDGKAPKVTYIAMNKR